MQPNTSIYGSLFGNQNCLPHKIILRLPVNAIIQNSKSSLENEKHTPKVSTIVTFSNQPETFYIRRIDELKDGLKYSDDDTCFAGKWSSEGDEVVFHASMERNLLISNPDITSIIFIVSLPLEIKEAKTKIFIDKYTWDRVGNENNFRFREYQNIKSVLRGNDKRKNNQTDDVSSGDKVNADVASELENLVRKGGLYLEKYVAELVESQGKPPVKYDRNQFPFSCAIPKDWN
ncbi:hypothetical protein [Dapis sp. BLCC M229]|uniref:hypothetical protein n=1 Tax=Dapis sp. BLCC M229 TaxID=3400188 RepID=UPI003CF56344